MRAAPIITITALALGATLVAGCSATGASSQAGDTGANGTVAEVRGGAPDAAPDVAADGKAMSAVTVDVAAQPQQAPVDRQVVRTASVTMRASDVAATVGAVRSLVLGRNGVITMEDTHAQDDATYSTLTAQVPASALDSVLAQLSRLGTVDAVSVNAQDVTGQVVDLDARIRALRTSTARMTQLLAQATRIEDMLAIETQLSQRQAELDSLTSQRDWLADQVAMSTVTVSLAPIGAVVAVETPGFLGGLERGWAAFVSMVAVGATAAGFLLPFLVLALLVVVPVLVYLLTRRRRLPLDA